MLVTPQLSEEIEQLLPKSQQELTDILQQLEAIQPKFATMATLYEIMQSFGNIPLLITKAENRVR